MAAAPDPVTDVWELLWTAACDYRDANPTAAFAVSRLIDSLMPIVTTYGDARVAKAQDAVRALADGFDSGVLDEGMVADRLRDALGSGS